MGCGIDLVERLLEDIDANSGGFAHPWLCTADIAAHQLLWGRYMTTGARRFGEAVTRSLRTICGQGLVEPADDSLERRGTAGRVQREMDLCDKARFLELLTWVWRVERHAELRQCAEDIMAWILEEMRVPGVGFVASGDGVARDAAISADANGLVLVALVEAGSVFERRDWLAAAREIFDEVVAHRDMAGELESNVQGGSAAEDRASMSRAAIRLFEAFGKQRYLDLAETWVATWDETPRDIADRSPSTHDALMIGVLARLHALTGTPHYAERATRLAESLHPVIARCATGAATAVANVEMAAQLLSIRVSGDPKLPETRAFMRIALDCGLPDRLVLGPGAGGALGERPVACISVGAHCLVPIDDVARLRTRLAPGGLADVFLRPDTCEPVDSRSTRGIP